MSGVFIPYTYAICSAIQLSPLCEITGNSDSGVSRHWHHNVVVCLHLLGDLKTICGDQNIGKGSATIKAPETDSRDFSVVTQVLAMKKYALSALRFPRQQSKNAILLRLSR